jgi:heme A synthase
MVRIALIAAAGAVACAALPSPGLFAALGLGIAAIGTGWLGYRRAGEPGFARLAGAAAVTVGAVGCLLGALRVALALAAIDRVDHLLGGLLG